MKANVFYISTIITMSFIVSIPGCATTPTIPAAPVQRQTYIDQAIWSETTKDKAYSACVAALHMEGFDIPPLLASRESGIIIPNSRRIYPHKKYWIASYKLQILVTEVQDNKVMVDLKVKADPDIASSWDENEKEKERINVNNRIAEDLKKFFSQLDILLGKAEHYRCDKVLEFK